MQLRDSLLVFSPSDLNDFLECEHLSALELAVARGELARAARDDPQAELVRRKGEGHEAAYLERLRAEGRKIAAPRNAAETTAAIRAQADVIYQAAFDDGGWVGYADFVELQPDGLYEVADRKVARTSKPTDLLHLASTASRSRRVQRPMPERMRVVHGTSERASYRVRDFDAYSAAYGSGSSSGSPTLRRPTRCRSRTVPSATGSSGRGSGATTTTSTSSRTCAGAGSGNSLAQPAKRRNLALSA